MSKPKKHGNKWRIRYFDADGKRQSEVFDAREEAVKALRKRKAEVDDIKDGIAKRKAKPRSFDELESYWIENRTALKRSAKDDLSIMRVHLRPYFTGRYINDITVEDGDRLIARTSHLSPKTTNNILTLLISMLRLAYDLEWIDRIPRIKKPRINNLSQEFNYLKSETEIRMLLTEAKAEGCGVFILYAIAIYTGMRAGEIAALTWADVDFKARIIKVQKSFDKLTKNGRFRPVPILSPLFVELKKWRLMNDNELVCPNRAGNMHQPSARIFQEILKRCLQRAGLEKLRFHDLRHSFASLWVKNGGDIFRLQRILGHSSIVMTQRYAHLAPDFFAEDFERLGSEIPVGKGDVLNFTDKVENER